MGGRTTTSADAPRLAAAGAALHRIGEKAGVTLWRWDGESRSLVHDDLGLGQPYAGRLLEDELGPLHPDDCPRLTQWLDEQLSSESGTAFQFRTVTPDRPTRYFDAVPVPMGDGTMIMIVIDVTRIHVAEMALRESVDHYRHAVAADPQVSWLADTDGRIVEVGPRWAELSGMTEAETLGYGWSRAVHPEDVASTLATWNESLETGKPLDTEYRMRLGDGSYRWMRARASARRDQTGTVLRWYGTLEDVHDRRLAEAALRDSESFSRSVLEASPMAIEVLDSTGHLIFMNGPGQRAMEVDDLDAIMGAEFEQFWPQRTRPLIRQAIAAAQRGDTVRRTHFGPTAKGTPRWWDLTITPILGNDGAVERLLALSSDVTEAKRNEAEIAHLARHDSLTGLPNRTHFLDRLRSSLDNGESLAVLSVDLDDFKLINDTMSHLAGDELLRSVAGRLRQAASRADLTARLGGDEFAVLLRLKADRDAAQMAQDILASLVRPFLIDGESISITGSIGIALAPRDGVDAESLLHAADVALYRVKAQTGRDFRFFEPEMDEALRERREMKRDLALALDRDEFTVVYQPQVDILTNRLIGFDALLRWRSPTRGDVPPSTFVPLAEESGLIDRIGAYVLRQACADATRWPERIGLAVNLSPAQFRNRGALRAVTEALAATGLSPRRLEIEITESVLFDGNVEAVGLLKEFHRMGIRVALDDFGTGYSSLSYLRRFAFDKIKIDRSFIEDLPASEESSAIVRAIISLGRALKVRIIAEGVETWEQFMLLQAEGCHEAQGYLFSRPIPEEKARVLARNGFGAEAIAPVRHTDF